MAIAFIDSKVADYQSLIAGVKPGTEVVILDGNRDAIAQITEILACRTNIRPCRYNKTNNINYSRVELEISNEQLAWDNKSGLKNRTTEICEVNLTRSQQDSIVENKVIKNFFWD